MPQPDSPNPDPVCATPKVLPADTEGGEAIGDEDAERHADASGALATLEDKLDGALADLKKRNGRLEDYLDFLAQERKRDLQGTEADQLTIEDIPRPAAESAPQGVSRRSIIPSQHRKTHLWAKGSTTCRLALRFPSQHTSLENSDILLAVHQPICGAAASPAATTY